jgi:hypothetical protein
LAATYALGGGGRFEWAVLREGFLSYRHFIDRGKAMEASYRLMGDDVRGERKSAFDREIPHHYFPFGALEAGDLPDLLAASGAAVTVTAPMGGDWEPLEAGAARALLKGRVRLARIEDWLHSRW